MAFVRVETESGRTSGVTEVAEVAEAAEARIDACAGVSFRAVE